MHTCLCSSVHVSTLAWYRCTSLCPHVSVSPTLVSSWAVAAPNSPCGSHQSSDRELHLIHSARDILGQQQYQVPMGRDKAGLGRKRRTFQAASGPCIGTPHGSEAAEFGVQTPEPFPNSPALPGPTYSASRGAPATLPASPLLGNQIFCKSTA